MSDLTKEPEPRVTRGCKFDTAKILAVEVSTNDQISANVIRFNEDGYEHGDVLVVMRCPFTCDSANVQEPEDVIKLYVVRDMDLKPMCAEVHPVVADILGLDPNKDMVWVFKDIAVGGSK